MLTHPMPDQALASSPPPSAPSHRYCLPTRPFSPSTLDHLVFLQLLPGFPSGSAVKNLPAMEQTQIHSLDWEDPPEGGMATHFSVLDWRMPWTEEPGGLQSTGPHRGGRDFSGRTQLLPGRCVCLMSSWATVPVSGPTSAGGWTPVLVPQSTLNCLAPPQQILPLIPKAPARMFSFKPGEEQIC